MIKYILPVFVLYLITSCSSEKNTDESTTETAESSNTIELTTKQVELGKMELGSFTNELFHKVVKATGILDVPPENKSTVSAYFGGYVKSISLLQGQKVTKGQTLFTLESPDYIQVQQDFLESKSQLNYLKSDYERQKGLSAGNVSSQKTYLKAESDYKSILARYESLKKKLQLMNMDANSVTEFNLSSTIAVKSPISGYITSVLATKGMFLNPSDIALTVMNTDHMHVELNIFEQDLPNVAIGQDVSFSIQNGKTPFQAKVLLINKAIDPEKRTIKVHCHFNNEHDAHTLTPGMFVDAEIYSVSENSLALPIDAVVFMEKKAYVLLKKKSTNSNLKFKKMEVRVGQTSEKFIEILNTADFTENSQFLTNGAFNLIHE